MTIGEHNGEVWVLPPKVVIMDQRKKGLWWLLINEFNSSLLIGLKNYRLSHDAKYMYHDFRIYFGCSQFFRALYISIILIKILKKIIDAKDYSDEMVLQLSSNTQIQLEIFQVVKIMIEEVSWQNEKASKFKLFSGYVHLHGDHKLGNRQVYLKVFIQTHLILSCFYYDDSCSTGWSGHGAVYKLS